MAASRRAGAWARGFALLAMLRAGSLAHADDAATVHERENEALGRTALPAADRVLLPVTNAAPISVAATGGYGVTESQQGEGAHHRVQGTLAAAVGLTPNIALSLAFDGRYDRHPGGDSGAVGEPELGLVSGVQVAKRLRVGAALQLLLPGGSAPSIDFNAPALSGSGLAEWAIGHGFSLSGMFGFRLDESAHAAPAVAQLSKADRLSLGLSDFNALPVGVAALQRFKHFAMLAELSGEVLVGKHAPDVMHSPLRAALGGRWPLAASLVGELLLELSLSQRSLYARVTPLIPEEPRFVIGLGLRYAPDFSPAPPAAPPIVPQRKTQLSGSVSDPEGAALAGVQVSVNVASHDYNAVSAEDGSFVVNDLPRGLARISTHGTGLVPATERVALDTEQVVLPLRAARVYVSSQLRGLIRSFAGVALPARISVLPDGGPVKADKDGRFMLELRAGEYEVEIECVGYLTQRRKISVQDNGVTLLNVEMHEAPR